MNKIALAAAMLCTSSVLMAQEAYVPTINPNWYVQPSFVGLKPDSNWGTDRDWGGGLKFGKAMSQAWDLQVGMTYVKTENGVRRYDTATLGADALLMLSRKQFRPFILLGVGLQHDDREFPGGGDITKNSPYVSAGLGFQIGLSDRMSLQADVRQVHARLRDDERFGFNHSNNRYLTIGLNYAMGPTPRPAPPPAPAPVVEAPAPAPEPVAAPAPAPAPARFEKITLAATELFQFDSARLQGSQPKLDEIATVLAADTSVSNIVISGHADRIGSDAYNQKLSEQRANAVREYLVSKGIDGGRLTAQGKGESMPVVTCTDKNRAALIKCLEPNRRVEVEQIVIERKVSQ